MSNKFLINSRCASRRSTSSPPYGHAKYQSSHSSVISTVYLRRHQRNCLPMNDCRSKLKQNQKKKNIQNREEKSRVSNELTWNVLFFVFFLLLRASVYVCFIRIQIQYIYLFSLYYYFIFIPPARFVDFTVEVKTLKQT